jgi:hypothetical protein
MFIAARLRQRSANAGLQRRTAPNRVSAQWWKDAVVHGLDAGPRRHRRRRSRRSERVIRRADDMAELREMLAVFQLTGLVLLLIPCTSVLGAILLTGYLGGAIATYVRIGEWYPPLVPFTTAVLAWLGLFLREPRLWVLLPFRRRS